MEKLNDKISTLFARRFEMFELVYNTKKNELQMVITEIPADKRKECGASKLKRSYICTKPKTDVWTIELAEDLRAPTIFEKV